MKYTEEEALARFLLEEDLQEYSDWEEASNIIISSYQDLVKPLGVYEYETQYGDYIVSDNYDELTESAKERVLNLIDDVGVSNLFNNSFSIERYLNDEFFEDIEKDELHNRFYELSDEERDEYEDEYEYAEEMMSDNSYEFCLDMGFNLDDLLKSNPPGRIIDIDELVSDVVDMDGVAHTLAAYDGEEYEQDGYWIYRTN